MLADAIGGVGAHVIVLDKVASAIGGIQPRLKVNGTRRMDPNVADRYMHEWQVFDPLRSVASHATGSPGTILLCHEFLSEDFVARDMYFQDFLIPSGGRYQAGVTLENGQESIAVLDIHTRDAPFEREQILPWAPVFAHLRRAVRLSVLFTQHLEREALLRRAIDHHRMVCLLVNDEARVVDQSLAGAEILAEDNGLYLSVDGRLRLREHMQTRRLHTLITNACHGRGGGEMPLGVCNAAIQVIPAGVTCDNPFNPLYAGCCLVLVETSHPRHAPDPLQIRLALGCSLAEAEVAAALASGDAPKKIAAERGTSIYTVRAQIRALLAATGTRRIAEFVGIILAS